MGYRSEVQEIDISQFTVNNNSQIYGFVINSPKGPKTPKFIDPGSESAFLELYGKPNADKWGGFEVIQYIRSQPAWVVSPIGAGALYAGIDVKSSSVVAFGKRSGRDLDSFINYNAVSTDYDQAVATGDGSTASFSGTLLNTPITPGSVQLKVAGNIIAVDDGVGGFTTAPTVISAGSINYTTGAYSFTVIGTAGNAAQYITKNSLAAPISVATIATAGIQEVSFQFPISGAGVPTFSPVPPDTYEITLAIDGGAPTVYSISVASGDDWNTILTDINTQLGGAAIASIAGGRLRFTSTTIGSSSSIVVTDAGTAPLFLASLNAANAYTLLTPINGKNAGIRVEIDGVVQDNIDLGNTTVTQASLVTAINTAFGSTRAFATPANYVTIKGSIINPSIGSIKITHPSALNSAVTTVIDTAATSFPILQDSLATNPTGYIPKAGESVSFGAIFVENLSTSVSHSFFAASPYDDAYDPMSANVVHLGGTKYQLTLYKTIKSKTTQVAQYVYSLTRGDKEGYSGRSIYIGDVFRDDLYVIPFINTSFVGTATPTSADLIPMTGGKRGADPLPSDFYDAYQNFQYVNKYRVKTLVDIYGTNTNTVNDIIQNYQPYAHGISCIPYGNNRANAIIARASLPDTDNVSLYTNWMRIEDVYNNSSAWVSGMGKVAIKYAQMNNVFDGMPLAGVDEDNHGGQLNQGFRIFEVERDYNDTDLQLLDEAGINPIINDPVYGVMIYGNKTMQVSNSDTSFVHTRRVYNYMIDGLIRQILRRQEFKFNDDEHRNKAKILADEFLQPIKSRRLVRELEVVCDSKNNTDAVLQAHKFIIDVYVKASPSSEKVILRFIRISQTQSIVQFLAA
jgi:hypothetical protein